MQQQQQEEEKKPERPEWGGNFKEANIGQVQYAKTFFDLAGKKQKEKKEVRNHAEYTYNTYGGPPASYPPKHTGWNDDGTHNYAARKPWPTYDGYPSQPAAGGWYAGAYDYGYPPRKPPSGYGGCGGRYYPPQPQPMAEWDEEEAYPPQKPPGYGGHPPPRAMDLDGGAQEKTPAQQRPPHEVNMKPAECKPVEPPPAADPPRRQPYGGYPPQYGEQGGYYGGSGYPPAQRRGYPPSRPSLPPPYQGGGQWDGYDGYAGAYMGGPKPAPPAGAYATYGAYNRHHGGYGGGGGGYGNGKYAMGHQGKFKHYAHHQGKF